LSLYLVAGPNLASRHPGTPTLLAVDSYRYLCIGLRVVKSVEIAGYAGAVHIINLKASSIKRAVGVVVSSSGM
jgi:hypothetical protein